MADTIVVLQLPARTVRALRDLGIVRHMTIRCSRRHCDRRFVPIDGRQVFCSDACAAKERQQKWRIAKKEREKEANLSRNVERLKGTSNVLPGEMLIAATNLSKREKNLCRAAGIITIGDLRDRTDVDLLKNKGLGRRSLTQLRLLSS